MPNFLKQPFSAKPTPSISYSLQYVGTVICYNQNCFFLLVAGQMSRIKCPKSYGISDDLRTVPDEKFEASTEVNENFRASQARLYNPTSSWCAASTDIKPTLTISLGGANCILGYAIQGDPSADNNVTELEIKRTLYDGSTAFDPVATHQVVSGFFFHIHYFLFVLRNHIFLYMPSGRILNLSDI